MPAKRYPVRLDRCQRDSLMGLISSGRESARKLRRARILLKADTGEFGSAYSDKDRTYAKMFDIDPANP